MKEAMSPSVIENFVVGIVTSIVTAIFVHFWRKIRESRIINRKAAFFGISPKDSCLVVMNHHPFNKGTMSHGDIETLVEIVRLVDEIGGELTIAPFDKVLTAAGEMTEFCIGGPSNHRTMVHIENFLKGLQFRYFLQDDPDSLAIITKEDKFKYEWHENEYAILARFYPNRGSHPVVLISGQTSRANQGAIHYLIKNHDTFLRREFGNKKSFCLIVKLQSPLTYGHKSVRLVKDITDIAFTPFAATA